MSDKDKDETKDEEALPEGMTSTAKGVETNEVVEQTPDQFYTGAPDPDEKTDPKHATKGMTSLGYTEASRLENTAEQQEADRKEAEKRAAKEDKD